MVLVFIWGGTVLLLVGSFLAYPYVTSRLAASPPTPTPMPSLPSSTATPLPPTAISPTSTSTAMPTRTRVPTPTPTPALPTRIVIPAINVDAPVIPVSQHVIEVDGQAQATWDVPEEYAAGWHETSASLGVHSNTVLNGHNTTNGEVFRDLYTLDTGTVITVYAGSTPYTYTVTEILILPEAGQPLEMRIENARYIMPTDDERLTLVTCHPYGSLRNRLVVIAHPAERPASSIELP
jgi:LPXTG-site transpeptidase (sortase) family protein